MRRLRCWWWRRTGLFTPEALAGAVAKIEADR